jgi:hypothetical protein
VDREDFPAVVAVAREASLAAAACEAVVAWAAVACAAVAWVVAAAAADNEGTS